MRRFQANAESPVYEELVALTRKTLGVQPTLQKALEPLASKLEAAFIYGSVAKGTDKARSDVDVMLAEYEGVLDVEESAIAELVALTSEPIADVTRLVGPQKPKP